MIKLFNKILDTLSGKDKINILILTILSFLAALLEMIGISLIIPIVTFFSQNELPQFLSFFENFIFTKNLNYLVLIFVILSISKNIFLIFFNWKKHKYLNFLQVNLSQRMFNNYLNKNYEFHVNNNSAVLHRNVYDDSIRFQSTIQSFINICLGFFTILSLLIVLLATEIKYTILLILLFLIIFFIFNFFVKTYSLKWGNKRHFHHGQLIQHLREGLSSIKEIKFLKTEKNFLKKYYYHQLSNAKYDLFYKVINLSPRFVLEIIFLLIILVFFLFFSDIFSTNNYEYIAIFVYSSLRIFPILNRLISDISNIKFNSPSVLSMSAELTTNQSQLLSKIINQDSKKDKFNNLILKDIDFKYQMSSNFIFKNLKLKINSNTATLITGKSGSGKSTLIDIILCLLKPLKGSIYLNDKIDITKNSNQWQKMISYIPQNPIFIDDTLKSNVALGSPEKEINDQKVIECLKFAKIYDDVSTLPDFLNYKIGEKGVKLSGGQKQRVAIARALYKEPEILIFDETTNSLDEKTEQNIIEDIIKLKFNKTILFVSHNQKIFKYFDNCLNIGKIKESN